MILDTSVFAGHSNGRTNAKIRKGLDAYTAEPIPVVRFYCVFFVRIKIIGIAVVTMPITKAPIAPCTA